MNILGYRIGGLDRDYWVNKIARDGQLLVLDAVSIPEVEVNHLGIIGSINPMELGAYNA